MNKLKKKQLEVNKIFTPEKIKVFDLESNRTNLQGNMRLLPY